MIQDGHSHQSCSRHKALLTFSISASRCTNKTVHVKQQLFTGETSCVLALSLQLPSAGSQSTGTCDLCNILAGREMVH